MRRLNPKDARFCVFCGCETLERDHYLRDRPHGHGGKYRNDVAEWICRTCGGSFRLHQSARSQAAAQLQGEMRKLRPGRD